MSEILRILVMYYACDIAAEARFPSPEEWARCMGYYTQVKTHFAAQADGPARLVEGYRNFKDWERANPALVADLRARSQL